MVLVRLYLSKEKDNGIISGIQDNAVILMIAMVKMIAGFGE